MTTFCIKKANSSTFEFSNSAFKKIFTYPPGAIRTKENSYFDRIHSDDRERVIAIVEEQKKKHETVSIECRYICKIMKLSILDLNLCGFMIKSRENGII